jgi:methionyl-tRNA formyltransferase
MSTGSTRRWILCGKNDAAVASLEHLVAQGDEVWAIGNRSDDGRDSWQRSLRAAAARLGVPFDQPERINDARFVERLAAFRADALISIQYDQILKANLFQGIGCPCLNLHFALLPRHRGVAPIAWALLEGDRHAGVTLHHMVVDIDAGAVIDQRAVPIASTTTARELYDAVTGATRRLFADSYPFPPELLAKRIPQDDARACYHRQGDFDFSVRIADWRRPATWLQRWLRAMIFPPMQYPEVAHRGERFSVRRVAGELEPDRGVAAGTVLECGPAGVVVAAAGGAVRLLELADPAGEGVAPGGTRCALRAGDRLAWEAP